MSITLISEAFWNEMILFDVLSILHQLDLCEIWWIKPWWAELECDLFSKVVYSRLPPSVRLSLVLRFLPKDSLALVAGFLAPVSHTWMKFGPVMTPPPLFVISDGTIYLYSLCSNVQQASSVSAIHGHLDLALAVHISTKAWGTGWGRLELPYSLWPLINTSLCSKFAPSVPL